MVADRQGRVIGSIAVLRPGLQTTIQDRGRWGLQSSGVSVAGPMDPWSHRLANLLVGNSADAATLEITLIGPELQFDDDRWVAVVGATFDIALDDRPVIGGNPWRVGVGSRLRMGKRSRGARAYLAVGGGIDVPLVLGSRATHVASGLGGYEGRALIAGDRLRLGVAPGDNDATDGIAEWRLRLAERMTTMSLREPTGVQGVWRWGPSSGTAGGVPGGTSRVRVLPGPQRDRFDAEALDQLQSAPYRVAQDSNRMGFRLEGPALGHVDDREMLSDATPFGVVQVPRSGQPILLMADHQTTGGYPKIATMISADAGVAGQLAPGDFLQFEICDERTALAELHRLERAFRELESLVS